MKHLKQYESIKDEPQLGDYVVIEDKQSKKQPNIIRGKIISIDKRDNNFPYFIDIKNKKQDWFTKPEILASFKTKEEVENYLEINTNVKKYNL